MLLSSEKHKSYRDVYMLQTSNFTEINRVTVDLQQCNNKI